jgi:hypothetical protein
MNVRPKHNFTFTFGCRNDVYDVVEALNEVIGRSRLHWCCNNRPLTTTTKAQDRGEKATVAFYINPSELNLDKLVQLCSNTTIRSIEEHT